MVKSALHCASNAPPHRIDRPASYGRYLKGDEFAKRFAPSSADVAAVKALLEHAGMTDVQVGPIGAYVSAQATVAQIRSTFNVTQNLYAYKGLTLRANAEAPALPAALAKKVVFLDGLDDTGLLRVPFHLSAYQGALVAPTSKAAASSGAGYNDVTGLGVPWVPKLIKEE